MALLILLGLLDDTPTRQSSPSIAPRSQRPFDETSSSMYTSAADFTLLMRTRRSGLPLSDILHRPRPATCKSGLELLPAELILEIVGYLALESKGCLATCSSTMADKIGMRSWFELQRVRKEGPGGSFEKYLSLLQRDRPAHYYCYTCKALHSVDYDGPLPWKHSISQKRFAALGDKTQDLLKMSLGRDNDRILPFHAAQKAMAKKRFHGSGAAPDTSPPLLHSVRTQDLNAYGYLKVFEMEARSSPSDDHLLLRTQHVLFRRASDEICPVLGKWKLRSGEVLCCHEDWDSRPPAPGEASFLRCCSGCPTEVRMRSFRLATGDEALVVTQWMDLGRVLSPRGRTWRAHAAKFDRLGADFKEFADCEWQLPGYGLSWIRDRFEEEQQRSQGGGGGTFEQLTDANMKRLLKLFPRFESEGIDRDEGCAVM